MTNEHVMAIKIANQYTKYLYHSKQIEYEHYISKLGYQLNSANLTIISISTGKCMKINWWGFSFIQEFLKENCEMFLNLFSTIFQNTFFLTITLSITQTLIIIFYERDTLGMMMILMTINHPKQFIKSIEMWGGHKFE